MAPLNASVGGVGAADLGRGGDGGEPDMGGPLGAVSFEQVNFVVYRGFPGDGYARSNALLCDEVLGCLGTM